MYDRVLEQLSVDGGLESSSTNDIFIKDIVVKDNGHALTGVESFAKKEIVSIKSSYPLLNDGFLLPDDSYFKRPVVLTTYSYTSASTIAYDYSWQTWLNHPMVSTRLKGCTLVRGDLKLRFDIASSPYHYGIVRAYFLFGPVHNGILTNTDEYQGSQALGVDIDVSIAGARELTIPFIFPHDYFCITDASSSLFCPNGVTATDSVVFGRLILVPITALARADSATAGTVTIVVRGFVDNLQLRGPSRCNFKTQSQVVPEVKPDHKQGVWGSSLAAFSRATGELSSVPVIGPLSNMVSTGFSYASKIADLFGFSRVNMLVYKPVVRRTLDLALTDTPVSVYSTAFTKDRQIQPSSKHLGIGDVDDMVLSKIAQRPSLVRKITWATTDARGASLTNIVCSPLIVPNNSSPVKISSVCAAALPFRYWRGSLIFTFRIICSKFHSGTLRVLYDPGPVRGNNLTVVDTTWPVGTTENCLITMSPGCSKDIQICYTRPERWAVCGSSLLGSATPTFVNMMDSLGYLDVVVENPLLAPLSTSSVTILVYIRGGPDFQVFGVKSTIPRYGGQTPAGSGSDMLSIADGGGGSGVVEEDNADPIEVNYYKRQSSVTNSSLNDDMCVFGGGQIDSKNISKDYFGEDIVSLRALLKRFVPLGYFIPTDAAPLVKAEKEVTVVFPPIPPDVSITAGTGNNLTYFTQNTLLRHFRDGFVGWKGGTRYRISDSNLYVDNSEAAAGAALACRPARFSVFPTSGGGTGSLAAVSGSSNIRGSLPSYSGVGSCSVDTTTGDLCDVELPNYFNGSFRYAGFLGSGVTSSSAADSVVVIARKECTDASKILFNVCVAAADDFSFLYWQGLPFMYFNP